jgi:hypothetical protein
MRAQHTPYALPDTYEVLSTCVAAEHRYHHARRPICAYHATAVLAGSSSA